MLLFLHLYCAILSHTWDDLHNSSRIFRECWLASQCMQWAGDWPLVTHCIRVQLMESPGRGPVTLERIGWWNTRHYKMEKRSSRDFSSRVIDSSSKKFHCSGFSFFSRSFHYIYNPLLDRYINFLLKASDLAFSPRNLNIECPSTVIIWCWSWLYCTLLHSHSLAGNKIRWILSLNAIFCLPHFKFSWNVSSLKNCSKLLSQYYISKYFIFYFTLYK